MKRFIATLVAALFAVASFNALACQGSGQTKADGSGGMSKPGKPST